MLKRKNVLIPWAWPEHSHVWRINTFWSNWLSRGGAIYCWNGSMRIHNLVMVATKMNHTFWAQYGPINTFDPSHSFRTKYRWTINQSSITEWNSKDSPPVPGIGNVSEPHHPYMLWAFFCMVHSSNGWSTTILHQPWWICLSHDYHYYWESFGWPWLTIISQ